MQRTVQLPIITATSADLIVAMDADASQLAEAKFRSNERIEGLCGGMNALVTAHTNKSASPLLAHSSRPFNATCDQT